MYARHYRAVLKLCLLVLIAPAGCEKKETAAPPAVAASTSYLECAAREFLGDGDSVLLLAGPGMCPGHFDIRPSQVRRLRGCRVLLRSDFQESLDEKLAKLASTGLRIVPVKIDGGLCEPASYLAACRQAAEAFVAAGLLDRAEADARLAVVSKRMKALDDWVAEQIAAAKLQGRPVLAGEHQAVFCHRLGLNVVATFRGSDTASIGDIDAAVQSARRAGVKIVVANLPAGRRLADALAEPLGAKVVVFGNFPATSRNGAFDKLIRGNVAKLVAASRQ